MATREKDTVRDRRAPGWLWIKYEVLTEYGPTIGATGVAVYAALARFANNETQTCFPSQDTIAKMLGLTRQTVNKALDSLEKAGLIEIRGRTRESGGRASNEYTLLPVPEHAPPQQGENAVKNFDSGEDGQSAVNEVDSALSNDLTGGVKIFDRGCQIVLHEQYSPNQTPSNQTHRNKTLSPEAAAPVALRSPRATPKDTKVLGSLSDVLDLIGAEDADAADWWTLRQDMAHVPAIPARLLPMLDQATVAVRGVVFVVTFTEMAHFYEAKKYASQIRRRARKALNGRSVEFEWAG